MPPSKPASHRPRSTSKAKKAGRPFASDAEVTRARILAAAQACFAARGFRETSNREVAEMADITSGTIYHYFSTKRDMFLAVHQGIQGSIILAIEQALSTSKGFADSVDRMMRTLLSLYIEHPNWMRFNAVVRIEARRNPEIFVAHNDTAWRKIFHELAAAGVANGEIDPTNQRAMQTVLSATILGLTQHGIEATAVNHVECIRGFSLLLRGMMVKPLNMNAAQDA